MRPEGNKQCLSCGNDRPKKVNRVSTTNNTTVYRCLDCGNKLAEGFLVTDGAFSDVDPMAVPPPVNNVHLPDGRQWKTLEGWWSTHSICVAINGRQVLGGPGFYKYVESLQEANDEGN